MKKIKVLSDKYILPLGIYGPILTPMDVDDNLYNELKNGGYPIEEVEHRIFTPSEGDKLLFTGEVTDGEIKDTKDINNEHEGAEVIFKGNTNNFHKKDKKKR